MQYKFSYCVEIREASQRPLRGVLNLYPILYMSNPPGRNRSENRQLTARLGDLDIPDRGEFERNLLNWTCQSSISVMIGVGGTGASRAQPYHGTG